MTSVESFNVDDLESLLVALQSTLGVVAADEQRDDLLERVKPLLSQYELGSLAVFASRIQSDNSGKIKSDLLDALSQRNTSWKLSTEINSILHDYIFDQLPDRARLWIVGCGQGQLAYAVAMAVAKYEKETGINKNFQLIATDVSQGNIDFATQGNYTLQQLIGVDEEDKTRFISMNDDATSGKVNENLRQPIVFRQCDLTADFQSLGAMDVIICPEDIVYFSNDRKTRIFRQFSSILKSGGIFLTDNSQAIMTSDGGLERVEHSAGTFYRKTSA